MRFVVGGASPALIVRRISSTSVSPSNQSSLEQDHLLRNAAKLPRSLLLIKPEIVAHPILLKMAVSEILSSGVRVEAAYELQLTNERASQLYAIHNGKFFFPRLVRHVTSGPVIAMRVSGDVRRVLGSSRLYPLPVQEEEGETETQCTNTATLRQRLALSDVRNVAHNSDEECAEAELALLEPFVDVTGSDDDRGNIIERILNFSILSESRSK